MSELLRALWNQQAAPVEIRCRRRVVSGFIPVVGEAPPGIMDQHHAEPHSGQRQKRVHTG